MSNKLLSQLLGNSQNIGTVDYNTNNYGPLGKIFAQTTYGQQTIPQTINASSVATQPNTNIAQQARIATQPQGRLGQLYSNYDNDINPQPQEPLNSNSNIEPQGNDFLNSIGGIDGALNIIGTLGKLYLGYQALQQQKKQFGLNKKIAEATYAQKAAAFNSTQQSRMTNDAAAANINKDNLANKDRFQTVRSKL